MSLPYELTTFPPGSVEILRFLGEQDSGAAFDEEIMEATGLSERAYGKAIRRLVTREYIDLQYEGSYALTEIGSQAAEAIAAFDSEAPADVALDEEVAPAAEEAEDDFLPLEEEFIEILETPRRVLVVYPSALVAGQPAYVFLRVEESTTGDALPQAVDVVFEVQGEAAVMPEQDDATIPEEGPGEAVRFEVTLPAPGEFMIAIAALQVTRADLLPVGEFALTLTAVAAAPAAPAFRRAEFDIVLQPGL